MEEVGADTTIKVFQGNVTTAAGVLRRV